MTDLTGFRDHCRTQAESAHRSACDRGERWTKRARLGTPRIHSCERTDGHPVHEFIDDFGIRWDCPGLCPGCATSEERALWTRLADEVDAYLAHEDEGEVLF